MCGSEPPFGDRCEAPQAAESIPKCRLVSGGLPAPVSDSKDRRFAHVCCDPSMNLQVDVERLQLAQKAVRAELLTERAAGGHWVGYVASSPFATAAAISALVAA